MKTAISIPDVVFHQVEEHAAKLKISRSAFFTHAVERYIAELDRDDAVARINAALDYIGETEEFEIAAAHGRRMLGELTADDEW